MPWWTFNLILIKYIYLYVYSTEYTSNSKIHYHKDKKIYIYHTVSFVLLFLDKSHEVLALRFKMHKTQECSIRNQHSIISHLAHEAGHYYELLISH